MTDKIDFTQHCIEFERFSGQGPVIGIGALPFRKSVALYTRDAGGVNPVAYFRSVEDAEAFLEALRGLLGSFLKVEGEA